MNAPLSPQAIARFVVHPTRSPIIRSRPTTPITVSPHNPIRVAAERLGRFTSNDLALAAGRSQHNCRTALGLMFRQGLVRKLTPQTHPVAVYERLDGGDMPDRVRNEGARLIEAMPAGHMFTRADLPGRRSQVNEAILKARRCGLIRRISPRQTHAIWEVVR